MPQTIATAPSDQTTLTQANGLVGRPRQARTHKVPKKAFGAQANKGKIMKQNMSP